MYIITAITRFLYPVLASFAGLWLGGWARRLLTGRSAQTITYEYQEPGGRTYRNFPVITKFWPALAFSLLGRPRWLSALVGGVLAGALIDDAYEALLLRWILTRVEGLREAIPPREIILE